MYKLFGVFFKNGFEIDGVVVEFFREFRFKDDNFFEFGGWGGR